MNISRYIGQTPLIKLHIGEPDWADIFVKIEHFNAGGSIKSRIAKEMIEEAEKKGLLHRGITIIEPTGGNTGIGLAIMSIIRGYNFIAVVPDNFSRERINLLRYYNTDVKLSDSSTGNDSHIIAAKKLLNNDPSLICLDQFTNQACITAHYNGTAKEILEYITPDAFVVCVGSSGTFTGVSSRLKEVSPSTKCFVAQPSGCDIMNGKAIPHKIQGVSLGIKPPLLDYSLMDGIIDVEYQDVRDILRILTKTNGLFLGLSSGANIVAACSLAKQLGAGKVICTVAPDGGQYYVDEIYKEL
jgi:cysteine synthase A